MAERLRTAGWVPRTKVVRPAPRPDTVVDDGLLRRLDGWLRTIPVTLVTAPAGAGKTTLAAAATERLDLPVSWVSLDGRDDGPMLLELLSMALEPILPGGCPGLAETLASPATAYDGVPAAGVLINDVLDADPGSFVVVLDDVHGVAPGAVPVLDYLVAHLPEAMHLLLLSRPEPRLSLARLRAQGRVADVLAADLRFTTRQADALLNDHLGMGLRRDAIEEIVEAAAGWVTGVRLLARTGSQLAVAGTGPTGPGAGPSAVYDYLAAEILDAEADDVRRFLLDTAVLTELTPAMCQAVTGRVDARAVLEDLHRRNPFFVVAVEPEAAAYRYHDLFAAFLRSRLERETPGRTADLHRRAAAAATIASTRVEHLLAAGDDEAAASAIDDIVAGGFPRPFELRRLAGWIKRLDPAVLERRPRLALALGMAAVQRGDMGEALGPLEHARAALDEDADYAAHWMAVRCLHLASNDHARYVPMLLRLEGSPRFSELPAAAQVDHHISSAYGALFADRWDEVAGRVAAALDLTMRTGDVGAAEVLAQHVSPLLAPADGALDRIEAYAGWVARRFGDGLPMIRLGCLHQQAVVAFLRGRFDEALQHVAAAGDLPERLGGLPFLRGTLDWVETAVWYGRGDLGAVERRITARRAETATDLDQELRGVSLAVLARTLRRQGRAAEVADLVKTVEAENAGSRYGDQPVLAKGVVRAHARWAAGALPEALAILRDLLPADDRARLVPFVGVVRLDLAIALCQAGDRPAAMAELTAVLRAAEARGMVGVVAAAGAEVVPLLEMARAEGIYAGTAARALAVLGRAAAPGPVPVPGSPEVLSSREVEVLHLLAEGASNHDIAAALVVSVNTVKTHVQRVLTKLGARSRGEAVARARQLRLL